MDIPELREKTNMCRSIKTLRQPDGFATGDEIHAAALQFVRKVSGYRTPSGANEAAFYAAVEEVARASQKLLESLVAGRSPQRRSTATVEATALPVRPEPVEGPLRRIAPRSARPGRRE